MQSSYIRRKEPILMKRELWVYTFPGILEVIPSNVSESTLKLTVTALLAVS